MLHHLKILANFFINEDQTIMLQQMISLEFFDYNIRDVGVRKWQQFVSNFWTSLTF